MKYADEEIKSEMKEIEEMIEVKEIAEKIVGEFSEKISDKIVYIGLLIILVTGLAYINIKGYTELNFKTISEIFILSFSGFFIINIIIYFCELRFEKKNEEFRLAKKVLKKIEEIKKDKNNKVIKSNEEENSENIKLMKEFLEK